MRPREIHDERDRKLEEARKRHQVRRQNFHQSRSRLSKDSERTAASRAGVKAHFVQVAPCRCGASSVAIELQKKRSSQGFGVWPQKLRGCCLNGCSEAHD